MWTPASRKRYADNAKQKKRYPTDLSDEEWLNRAAAALGSADRPATPSRFSPGDFVALTRRGVVERTFGWLMRWRRLVRDYEQRLDVSHNMIYVAIGALLLRRIT